MMTAEQTKRLQEDLSRYAKEQVRVEQIGDTAYAYGSEIATLRLFAHYNANGYGLSNTKVRVGYSQNKGTHFFSLILQF